MQPAIPSPAEIEEAVGVLRRKGVVAFPTDTLYGLGADAFSAEAVARVFEVKGRPAEAGLPILLGSRRDLELVAVQIPEMAWRLAERFWPGALTLILWKSPKVPSNVTGGMDSVAVRIPDHPVPLALIRGLGKPITGTSANPSGSLAPVTAEEVRGLVGKTVDYVLDGGTATAGRPSTIVDLTGRTPRLVRPGVIPYDSIRYVCSLSPA